MGSFGHVKTLDKARSWREQESRCVNLQWRQLEGMSESDNEHVQICSQVLKLPRLVFNLKFYLNSITESDLCSEAHHDCLELLRRSHSFWNVTLKTESFDPV